MLRILPAIHIMAYSHAFSAAIKTARRHKEGRGTGIGADYKPWLRTSDVPSLGRRHRIYSPKFKRTFHLLSDLELHAFYYSEFLDEVSDNREQFPLPIEKTKKIADDLAVDHPRPPGSLTECVMTTDQVWTRKRVDARPLKPVIVKYTDALTNERTVEKLAIEWELWADHDEADTPLLFTEQSVSQNFIRNWGFIRDTLRPDFFDSFPTGITDLVDDALCPTDLNSCPQLGTLFQILAQKLACDRAIVIPAVHYNIASRRWPVDLDATLLMPSRHVILQGT